MDYTPKEKQFSCRWIADGIGTDYIQWVRKTEQNGLASATRVFIESPTGTGKTSFILKTLMPFAREKCRNILYLGNRTALREQTSYAAQNALIQANHPNLKIDDENDGSVFSYSENSPHSITVLNYQSFLGFVKCNHLGTPPLGNPFYYIIFDEAHFFLEDSLFNPMTWAVLEKLAAYFNNSVFIFMSATMEESVYPLLRTLDMFRPAHPQQLVFDSLYRPDIYFYQNTFREAKYKVRFFYKQAEIVQAIADTDRREKWLIFVSSKRMGEELKKQIKEDAKCSARFLAADGKNSKLWKRLVEDSSFVERILIVTKVLDNGANIEDEDVKHIVLPFCTRVDLIQMLGRKRILKDEEIFVYIAIPSIQTINSQLRRVNQMQTAVDEVLEFQNSKREVKGLLDAKIAELRKTYANDTTTKKQLIDLEERRYGKYLKETEPIITALLQKYWRSGIKYINCLFYINWQRELVANPLAQVKIGQLKGYYSALADHNADPEYYMSIVRSWLGLEESGHLGHLSMDGFISLDMFLSHYLGEKIPEARWERFYSEFQYLYKQRCHELFDNDKERLKALLGIRKGKTQRKATMNKSLAALNLPYEIKKHKNCWILCQKSP